MDESSTRTPLQRAVLNSITRTSILSTDCSRSISITGPREAVRFVGSSLKIHCAEYIHALFLGAEGQALGVVIFGDSEGSDLTNVDFELGRRTRELGARGLAVVRNRVGEGDYPRPSDYACAKVFATACANHGIRFVDFVVVAGAGSRSGGRGFVSLLERGAITSRLCGNANRFERNPDRT